MRERVRPGYTPGLESLEAKQLLSPGTSSLPLADAATSKQADTSTAAGHHGSGAAKARIQPLARKPRPGFLVYRITNPNIYNNKLNPPFSHVRVQTPQPVPGQVYNVLYVAVRNGTAQTIDASRGFRVQLTGQKTSFPILTGDQKWKPGDEFVFYILTKKYYPLRNQVTSGYVFNLEGARSVVIPGPSGIFLRVKYDPAKFDRTLDWIVTRGPGAQGGKGIKYGLPDTAIAEFLSAKTRRIDFGGYF